jgi:YVTN family beta-propeller protein
MVLLFSYSYISSGIQPIWAATLEDSITVGEGLIALAFNPSDDNLYAANFNSNNISVIDTSSNTIEDSITVGEGPIALAFNPNDDNLYAATETTGNVSTIQP